MLRKSTFLFAVILTGSFSLSLIAYEYRIYLSAWVWHVGYGSSVTIRNYIVPVPKNWYVQDEGTAGQGLIRLDTDDRAPTKRLKAHASISITENQILATDKGLTNRRNLDLEYLQKNGVNPILQKLFPLNEGKVISCSGGYKPGSNGILDVEAASWFCSSPGLELTILATEPDMKQVWEIVGGIRTP